MSLRGFINARCSVILNAFAQWVIRTRPADIKAPDSTGTGNPGLCAYVIRDENGAPYMTRVLFPRVFGRRAMLHHIHRADYARDLHNHPYANMRSLILLGSYDEERLIAPPAKQLGPGRELLTVFRRCTWWNRITARDFHRITALHGEVWTLFMFDARVQSWGFLEYDNEAEAYGITPNQTYRERHGVS